MEKKKRWSFCFVHNFDWGVLWWFCTGMGWGGGRGRGVCWCLLSAYCLKKLRMYWCLFVLFITSSWTNSIFTKFNTQHTLLFITCICSISIQIICHLLRSWKLSLKKLEMNLKCQNQIVDLHVFKVKFHWGLFQWRFIVFVVVYLFFLSKKICFSLFCWMIHVPFPHINAQIIL